VKTTIVIPARYASTRFPGKPLAIIAGKPMIQWVFERASQTSADEVLVATDDQRIADCVSGFGGAAVLTRADHPTGTDRIAEVMAERDADLVVNLQGDEPAVPPPVIDQLIEMMADAPACQMGTVAVPIAGERDFDDPNVVKVVLDQVGRALYFSRARIPFPRDGDPGNGLRPLRHWGVYAYRRDFLFAFIKWPQGQLEAWEKLEQLRVLEHGTEIRVMVSDITPIGVDVPEDVPAAAAMLVAQETQDADDER
jgi:3-deoxy-manno-octulosonate cytidylyltransferase (CMP-KDO synthetase)